jgi:hypothetical protein
MWMGGQRHASAALLPGKRLGARCTGSLVGLGADLDGEHLAPSEFELWTVQPIASSKFYFFVCFKTNVLVLNRFWLKGKSLKTFDIGAYKICDIQISIWRSGTPPPRILLFASIVGGLFPSIIVQAEKVRGLHVELL